MSVGCDGLAPATLKMVSFFATFPMPLRMGKGIYEHWLLKICKTIGMTPIPVSEEMTENPSVILVGVGWHGRLLIAESHIIFHEVPSHKLFFLDVVSCKPFDVDILLKSVAPLIGVPLEEPFILEHGV